MSSVISDYEQLDFGDCSAITSDVFLDDHVNL